MSLFASLEISDPSSAALIILGKDIPQCWMPLGLQLWFYSCGGSALAFPPGCHRSGNTMTHCPGATITWLHIGLLTDNLLVRTSAYTEEKIKMWSSHWGSGKRKFLCFQRRSIKRQKSITAHPSPAFVTVCSTGVSTQVREDLVTSGQHEQPQRLFPMVSHHSLSGSPQQLQWAAPLQKTHQFPTLLLSAELCISQSGINNSFSSIQQCISWAIWRHGTRRFWLPRSTNQSYSDWLLLDCASEQTTCPICANWTEQQEETAEKV